MIRHLPVSLDKAALVRKAEQEPRLRVGKQLWRERLRRDSPGPRRPPCFKPCALSRLSRYHVHPISGTRERNAPEVEITLFCTFLLPPVRIGHLGWELPLGASG